MTLVNLIYMVSQRKMLTVPPILEATSRMLRDIAGLFDPEILQWRPSPQRWSCAMVVAHLAESEVNCFRPRLMRTALQDSPLLEPYDQWKRVGSQETFRVEDEIAAFERARSETLTLLRNLPETVLERPSVHTELGPITFANLLYEFAFHDMGHLRQILELCRARAYYPLMGAWCEYYRVTP